MNPFRSYFRGRLHRRIFVWFGISIAITTAVVVRMSGHSAGSTVERAETFLAGQLSEVWDTPDRRDALATAVARDLALAVRLSDGEGVTLGTYGGSCDKHALRATVRRGNQILGYADLCDEPGRRNRFYFLVPFLVGMAMLWAASGAIARRLLWPLYDLTRVAQDIGRGHLKSRVRVSRRHHTEFSVLGNVMNEMAARIEQQLADQRALLATVSHEIRTPLSRMRLLIEFARQKTETAQNAGDTRGLANALAELGELEREVTDIDALVSDLLASSRVDFTALTTSRLDAVEVAKTALERAAVDPAKLVAPAGPVSFEGDATLVARAVSNLLENAKRHAGGVETLRVESRATSIAFIVDDLGQGFKPGEETRVFEPFYKGPETSSRKDESIGLGLALVKKIAEAHHGRVFAENREGGGARVGIELARGPGPLSHP